MEKMTVKQFKEGKGFWADRDQFLLDTNLKDDILVNFAYTDYGGDFFDRVAIDYFIDRKEACFSVQNTSYFGKNGLLYGETAKAFLEATEDYPLGFEDIEDYYFEKQNETERKSFESFLDDLGNYTFDRSAVLDWLLENKSGYFSVLSSGTLDFCSSSLESELFEAGLIELKTK